jgi:hypothetical protein
MMNWKECGKKWSWPKLRYYHSICLERLRKSVQNQSGWLVFRLKFELLELSDMKKECCPLNCDVGVMQLIKNHTVNKETVPERWRSQLS